MPRRFPGIFHLVDTVLTFGFLDILLAGNGVDATSSFGHAAINSSYGQMHWCLGYLTASSIAVAVNCTWCIVSLAALQ